MFTLCAGWCPSLWDEWWCTDCIQYMVRTVPPTPRTPSITWSATLLLRKVPLSLFVCRCWIRGSYTQQHRQLHTNAHTHAGVDPWWLYPEVDPLFHVAQGITPDALRSGLQQARAQQKRVAGVLVVSPTYYGAVSHIKGAQTCTKCESRQGAESYPGLLSSCEGCICCCVRGLENR